MPASRAEDRRLPMPATITHRPPTLSSTASLVAALTGRPGLLRHKQVSHDIRRSPRGPQRRSALTCATKSARWSSTCGSRPECSPAAIDAR